MFDMADKEDNKSVASSTPSATWRGWLWDTVGSSQEEKRFILKVREPHARAFLTCTLEVAKTDTRMDSWTSAC
jgi:hypothetical protein